MDTSDSYGQCGALGGNIIIKGNLCEEMQGTYTGGLPWMIYMLCDNVSSPATIDIEHNTFIAASTGEFNFAINYSQQPSIGYTGQITVKNNLMFMGSISAIGVLICGQQELDGMNNSTMTACATNISVSNNLFYLATSFSPTRNAGIISNGVYQTGSDNNNYAVYTSIGFNNLTSGYLAGKDYRLSSSSPYRAGGGNYNGTDSLDPGANVLDTTIYNQANGGGGAPPAGPTASLSSNVTAVSPGTNMNTAQLTWTCTGTGIATTLLIQPTGGSQTTQALTPATGGSISETPLVTTTYQVSVTDASNNTALSSPLTITATPVTPSCSISAQANPVMTSQNVLLNWTSTNAQSATLQVGSGTSQSVATSMTGYNAGPITGTTIFTLSVTSITGNVATNSVTVQLTATNPPPTINNLAASPNPVTTSGGTTTLTWISANSPTSGTVAATPQGGTTTTTNISSGSLASGGITVTPTAPSTTYVVTLINVNGQNQATVTVGVNLGAPVCSISVVPNPLNLSHTTMPGQGTVTITLTSTGGSTSPTAPTLNGLTTWTNADGTTHQVPLNGTLTDMPQQTTTYTFAVTNAAGTTTNSAKEIVTVGSTILNINAPGGIHIGDATSPPAPTVAWLLDLGGAVFNVDAFGATGNGTTDDTASIQAAINYSLTQGCGRVFLNAGTYLITQTLLLGGQSSAQGVSLVGPGGQDCIINWGLELRRGDPRR